MGPVMSFSLAKTCISNDIKISDLFFWGMIVERLKQLGIAEDLHEDRTQLFSV